MFTIEVQGSVLTVSQYTVRISESLRYSSEVMGYDDALNIFDFIVERCETEKHTPITLPFEDMQPDICIVSLFNNAGELLKMQTIRR